MDYTVEVYKADGRTKQGERLVNKFDHRGASREELKHLYETSWFAKDGYRFEIHETWVTKHNLMGGGEFQERYDTPHFCSPASESFWSM